MRGQISWNSLMETNNWLLLWKGSRTVYMYLRSYARLAFHVVWVQDNLPIRPARSMMSALIRVCDEASEILWSFISRKYTINTLSHKNKREPWGSSCPATTAFCIIYIISFAFLSTLKNFSSPCRFSSNGKIPAQWAHWFFFVLFLCFVVLFYFVFLRTTFNKANVQRAVCDVLSRAVVLHYASSLLSTYMYVHVCVELHRAILHALMQWIASHTQDTTHGSIRECSSEH